MYKNRISRPTSNTTTGRHPQFFIRRSDIAYEVDKRRYVESAFIVKIFQGRTSEPGAVVTGFLNRNSLGRTFSKFLETLLLCDFALKKISGTRLCERCID